MNIFILDNDPIKAAQYHCDKHVVKMILESAQMLSTAHHVLDGEQIAVRRIRDGLLRPTHENHPCSIWARETAQNYLWLNQLLIGLLAEYHSRYGRQHKFAGLGISLGTLPIELYEYAKDDNAVTPFVQVMPEQYKHQSAVRAYRDYYFYEKNLIATWKYPAVKPRWWTMKEQRKEYAA